MVPTRQGAGTVRKKEGAKIGAAADSVPQPRRERRLPRFATRRGVAQDGGQSRAAP